MLKNGAPTAIMVALLMLLPATSKADGYDTANMPLGCLGFAANEFQIPAKLLHALYLVERGRLGYATRNNNGSLDHGPFSINTKFLPVLAQYGISDRMLASDPMINARAGAWRLKSEIILAKGDVWKGVGNYRSKTPKYHQEEIDRVYNQLARLPDLNYGGECYGAS